MFEFRILKQSKKSGARLGVLKTSHGEVETPTLVPVATQGVVKALANEGVVRTGTQILIANTFHLHLRPGESVVRRAGGLHRFMHWRRPLMTDSGGFQVFSLGFGRDLRVGKVLKYFPGARAKTVRMGMQPRHVRITEDGVRFRSPLDGRWLFLGPRESMRIQEALGADIVFAFDECTPPLATRAYAEHALMRTHRWAALCRRAQRTRQALFGIVQGSCFKPLREASARFMRSLEFDGFGIGGDLGNDKRAMRNILAWIMPNLDPRKPRHLLGIGQLEDMEAIVKAGVDLFDCTVPTHYARHGVAFTSGGRLDMRKGVFLKQHVSLDRRCRCEVCQTYSRSYLAHLIRAKEITGLSLLTFHNLYFFNAFVARCRVLIKKGKL